MARRNYHGAQFNQSPTIIEKAGANIDDCRNRIMKYDENGNVVLATAGTDMPIGIAIIEAGYNDISGVTAGMVKTGEAVDILVKDMGVAIAGADIKKGQEVAAGADGLAAVRDEFARLMADKAHLEAVMKAGADEAAYYARKTMSKVRRKIGFVN